MLVNEHRTAWRRPWRRREVVTDRPPERGHPADRVRRPPGRRLGGSLRTLPPRQRAVVVLRYYEQLTEPETAEARGISVGTVKSQASRAIASLRAHLDQHPEITDHEEER